MKRFVIKGLFVFLFSLLILETQGYDLPRPNFTPTPTAVTEGGNKNGAQNQAIGSFTGLIQNIGNGLVSVAAGIAILFIVINGAKIVFSLGDSERLTSARKGIMWSILGLLLIIFTYVIIKSIVALLYSGDVDPSTQTQEQSQQQPSNSSPSPSSSPIPGGAGGEPTATNLNPLCGDIQLPNSCYDDSGNTTTDSPNCDYQAFNKLKVQKICSSANLNIGETLCTAQEIQATLKNKGFYDNPSTADYENCDNPDGKYGVCTKKAVENYINKKCNRTTRTV